MSTDVVGHAWIELRARGQTLASDIEKTTNQAVNAATGKIRSPKITPEIADSKIVTGLARIGAVADKNLTAAATKSNLFTKALGNLESAGVSVGETLVASIGVGALGAIAAFTAGGISKFVELTGEIRRFQAVTGDSAENASRFVVALRELGISSDVVARSFFRLESQIGAGKQPLAEFGIALRATNDSKDLFFQLSDAIQSTTDASQRARIAQAAFGRQGLSLLPILEKNRQELEEFFKVADSRGEVFSQKDIDQARAFQISIRSLHEAVDALEISAAKDLVPTLASLARGVAVVIDKASELTRSVGGLSSIFRGVLSAATGGLSDILIHLGNSHKAAGDAAEAQAEAEKRLTEQLDSVNAQATAIIGLAAAHQQAADAAQANNVAQLELAAAQQDLAAAAGRTGKIAEDQAKAYDTLRQAEQSLEEVEHRRVTTAFDLGQKQRELQIAILEAGRDSNRAKQAQEAVNDALFSQKRAEEELTDAKNKKTDAQKKADTAAKAGGEGSPEQREAFLRLIAAQDAATKSAENLATARANEIVQVDAANGVVDSANTKLGIFRSELDKIGAATKDGTIAAALKAVADEIDRIQQASSDGGFTQAIANGVPPSQIAGASSLGGAGTVGAGRLGGAGSVGAGTLGGAGTITVNNTFNNQTDPTQAAAIVGAQIGGNGRQIAQ